MSEEVEIAIENNLMSFGSKSDERYKPGIYNVSELIYCPRKAYLYRKYGVVPKANGKMLAGTLVHEKLPEILKNIKEFKGAKFEQEARVVLDDITIVGHADIVTKDCVYEFKFSAAKLTKDEYPIHFVMQANAYAAMFNKPKWAVIVTNSYSLKTTIMRGKKDPIAFDMIKETAQLIDHALKYNLKLDGPKYKWECRYCDVIKECREEDGHVE